MGLGVGAVANKVEYEGTVVRMADKYGFTKEDVREVEDKIIKNINS